MRKVRICESTAGVAISIWKLLTRVGARAEQNTVLNFLVGEGKNTGSLKMMTGDRADGSCFKGAGAAEGHRSRSSLDALVGARRVATPPVGCYIFDVWEGNTCFL